MFEVAFLIGVVVALTQLAKQFVPTKYIPLVSLALGIVAGIFYVGGDIKEQIMWGIVIGLSASGLYDQSKIITKGDK
jgi:hypothetical protein